MLQLTDIKPKLPFTISVGLSGNSIRDYVENSYNDIIDFDVFLPTINKNLQRPLCWGLMQKQALILSVFRETYIPPICCIHIKKPGSINEPTTIQVIDGKQRLSTMLAYFNNEFPIEVNGQTYYFKDLSIELQKLYARFRPTVNVAYSYTYADGDTTAFIADQSKLDWFELINFAGTPQDIEHLNSLKS